MDFDTLLHAKFGTFDTALTDWNTLVTNLEKLEKDASEGLKGAAAKADWSGVNSQVGRRFIDKTAGEFADAHTQATSVRNILRDTLGELKKAKGDLEQAISSARQRNVSVVPSGKNFTAKAVDGDAGKDVTQATVDGVRDEIDRIIRSAAESDSSAAKILRALVDQAEKGFGDAKYADRDQAAAAIKEAEDLAALAKKDPGKLTEAEFDKLLNGLTRYSGDDLFATTFAQKLGAQGTLDFWAGLNDPNSRDHAADGKRFDQYKDLQKQLGLTLANATQSGSTDMSRWKFDMLQAVEKPVGGTYGVSGYVVMSNLMRWGDYDDDFLTGYGTNMLAKEQEGVRNGARPEQIWGYHGGGLWPHLNTTGTDFGFDPMTGYMKALSHSPDAATEFFNSEFIAKDAENNPFTRDTDGNGKKGHIGLSNFQYLFEEREWMQEQDSEGEDSISGKNYLAAALEAATTGHPAGELPTSATSVHSEEQAKLYADIVKSVSQDPSRLTDNSFMSDSMGQISAEYMADIHRGLRAGDAGEDRLYPIAGAAAPLNEQDLTRFLYTVGQNPEGYAAVSVGQHAYTAGMLEHHFAHPDAFVDQEGNTPAQNLEKATGAIAHNAGEIQGMLGAGRAYAAELDAGNKDAEFNDAITKAGELGESLVGIGVGVGTASMVGPGGVIVGGIAETVAGEIIGGLTDGLMKDSSGEVIYRNGEEINATRESTFALVEKAAQESEKKSGASYPGVVSSIAGQAEAGFTSAHTNIRDYCEGMGVPNELEKDK
ncbi:hypothetical protein ACFFSH_07225 [Streptomyces filamentosus]|uniref:AG2 protein n=1 Tax=Streptomyces filamentosus TaxID=67294 RepID=A0A919EL58_STRFL|nr:hypothetical protein [Streptomyces filamentosus]GHF97960.1 hypothetical protein GCM10017667_30660 [Streptomyces filamentosus]